MNTNNRRMDLHKIPTARQARLWPALISLVALGLLSGCATSPTGRSQLLLVSDSEMDQMGVAAFAQMKQQNRTAQGGPASSYVNCVALAVAREAAPDRNWEVVVFEDDTPNAFALPGGKIGVHTGLLDVAENQHQLAAVLGHEVGHVLAKHSNARMSNQMAASGLTQIASIAIGDGGAGSQMAMAALGVGMQYGVLMPYGRADESESDVLGLEYMAKAGFDPRQSVNLWQNMAKAARAAGGEPPEFLSTHPSSATRIAELRRRIPSAMAQYERARAAGKRPNCR